MGFGYRTYTRLGKKTLRGHKQKLGCTRTWEVGAVTPQEAEPELPVGVRESLVEAWVNSGLTQDQGTDYIPGSRRVLA